MLSSLRSFLGYADDDSSSPRSRSSSVSSAESTAKELDVNYFNLGLATIVPAVGTFLYGYDQGSTTFLIEGLKDIGDDTAHKIHDGTNYYLLLVDNVYMEGLVAAMTVIGALILYPILYYYAHVLPKKYEMILSAMFYVAGSLFVVGSGDFSWFDAEEYKLGLSYLVVGRVLYGFGVAAAFHSVPQYLAEISPDRLRGSVLAMLELSIVAGLIFGTLSGYTWGLENGEDDYTNADFWIGTYSTASVIAAGWGVGVLFIPRIPRMMMTNGYTDVHGKQRAFSTAQLLEAVNFVYPHATKATIKRIKRQLTAENRQTAIWRRIYGVDKDGYEATNLGVVSENSDNDNEGGAEHTKDKEEEPGCRCACDGIKVPEGLEFNILWKDPVLFRCLSLLCLIKIFAVMTGKGTLTYNGIQTFSDIGASHSSLCFVMGTLIMGCTITPLFLFMEALPRRTWFLLGLGITILGQTMFILFSNSTIDVTSAAIAGIYIYFAGYEISFGVNSWTIGSEIFPYYVRGAANGVATMVMFFFSATAVFLGPLMESTLGVEYMMCIFLGFTVVGTIVIYLFVPETRGINPEFGYELVNEQFANACGCFSLLHTEFLQGNEDEGLLDNGLSPWRQTREDGNDDRSDASGSTSNRLSTSTRDQGSPKPSAAGGNWMSSSETVGGDDSDVDSSAVGSDYR